MLKHYASHALKKDHIGIQDPKNPEVWLVKPKSRKYHSHSERYEYDKVYARQCRENGAVDKNGKLTHRHQAEDGTFYFVDYEKQEADRIAARNKGKQEKGKGKGKGAGKGKRKPAQQPSQHSWDQQAAYVHGAANQYPVTWVSRSHGSVASSSREAEIWNPGEWQW